MVRLSEMRKATETPRQSVDGARHELMELESTVGLAIGALVKNEPAEPADVSAAVDALFVVSREMQRLADDLSKVVEEWKD